MLAGTEYVVLVDYAPTDARHLELRSGTVLRLVRAEHQHASNWLRMRYENTPPKVPLPLSHPRYYPPLPPPQITSPPPPCYFNNR